MGVGRSIEMYNFFADAAAKRGDMFYIEGGDRAHIINVLRMKPGEELTVCCDGRCYLCRLGADDGDGVTAEIIGEEARASELTSPIYLFQGLPKGDKPELIIQKAVELGAYAVIFVEMSRSVVKLDEKKKASRLERWRAVAESAAKQCKRNVIPQIYPVMSFGEAVELAARSEVFLLPYENERGMEATREALGRIRCGGSVSIMIGPEGGFEPQEAELARASGALCISLGSRILRTETAAITALAMCMLRLELDAPREKGAEDGDHRVG